MKKLLLVLLMLVSPLMGQDKKEPILGQVYIEWGGNIGNTMFLSNFHKNNINLGVNFNLGINWNMNSYIISLDILNMNGNMILGINQNLLAIGIGYSITALNFSIGNQQGSYSYFIDLFGFGLEVQAPAFDIISNSENRAANILIGMRFALPLGFKVLFKNNAFISVNHTFITLLDASPIAYQISFTIGKRFDIKSSVRGLK